MSAIHCEAIEAGYESRRVLHGITLDIAAGQSAAIIGPNGSGKSTLLKCMARLLQPWKGSVLLDGQPLGARPTREIAKRVAVLSQNPVAPPELTVAELAGYGRYPHVSWSERFGSADHAAVDRAIEACALRELAGRKLATLSGGERQRAWLAMALAQEPRILLLDEPIAALDIAHQLELLELLKTLNARDGITVVMVLHDINLAMRYADRMVLMKAGLLHAEGESAQVATAENIRNVFGVDVHMAKDEASGDWSLQFYPTPASPMLGKRQGT